MKVFDIYPIKNSEDLPFDFHELLNICFCYTIELKSVKDVYTTLSIIDYQLKAQTCYNWSFYLYVRESACLLYCEHINVLKQALIDSL